MFDKTIILCYDTNTVIHPREWIIVITRTFIVALGLSSVSALYLWLATRVVGWLTVAYVFPPPLPIGRPNRLSDPATFWNLQLDPGQWIMASVTAFLLTVVVGAIILLIINTAAAIVKKYWSV